MTDTSTVNRDHRADGNDDKPTEPKRLFDLSATQLVGGALAAMTSAVIGARLGVAGTILGAAIGSIVAGIAGSLYTASLKHTKEKLTSALVGRVGDTRVEITHVAPETAADRDWSWQSPAEQAPPAAVAPASAEPVARAADVGAAGLRQPRMPWKPILISTAAVFLLAIAGLTTVELISGKALSGGQGTTITQVSEGRSGDSDERPSPSSTPSAESSTEPTPESSATPEPSPSSTTEPSASPSESAPPSESSEPSASSEPTESTSPSTASGEASASADGEVVAGG
ncbi:MAG TPA: hypothetical protein VFU98_03465 [Microlunatus sp.]|nr:hypothetical protein [Microlunatus sp.]